jgi:hypothetical protein
MTQRPVSRDVSTSTRSTPSSPIIGGRDWRRRRALPAHRVMIKVTPPALSRSPSSRATWKDRAGQHSEKMRAPIPAHHRPEDGERDASAVAPEGLERRKIYGSLRCRRLEKAAPKNHSPGRPLTLTFLAGALTVYFLLQDSVWSSHRAIASGLSTRTSSQPSAARTRPKIDVAEPFRLRKSQELSCIAAGQAREMVQPFPRDAQIVDARAEQRGGRHNRRTSPAGDRLAVELFRGRRENHDPRWRRLARSLEAACPMLAADRRAAAFRDEAFDFLVEDGEAETAIEFRHQRTLSDWRNCAAYFFPLMVGHLVDFRLRQTAGITRRLAASAG